MVSTYFKCIGTQDGIVTYEWTVTDTGIGMSEEFLEHIFEPFVQEKTDARMFIREQDLGWLLLRVWLTK